MKFKKTIEVKNIFNKISHKYDFLNNLLSFGMHKLWKRKLINLLEPLNGEDWADLCCGTGDLAFLISERVSPMGSITGIDSAEDIYDVFKEGRASAALLASLLHDKKLTLQEIKTFLLEKKLPIRPYE